MEITALLAQVQPKTADTSNPEIPEGEMSFIHILQAAADDTAPALPAGPAFGTGDSNPSAAAEIAPRNITAGPLLPDPLRAGDILPAAPEEAPEDAAPKQNEGEIADADTAPAAPAAIAVAAAADPGPGGGESLPSRPDSPIAAGPVNATPHGDSRQQGTPTAAEPAPASVPGAPDTARNTGFQAADSVGAVANTTPAATPGGAASEGPLANTAASSGGPAAAPAPEAPRPSAPPPILQAPVASQPWRQELGRQVVELVQRGGERMELRLNPRELGPLSVTLKVDDGGAQAQFFSAHAAVRGAVEQAIPQLREALAQQGIALGEASVGEQRQQSGQRETAGRSHSEPAGDMETGPEAVRPTPVTVAPAGRSVDLYA